MYASSRAPGRPRTHRLRTSSDPGYPYVTPPYKTAWPPPARRQATEPSPSVHGSVETQGRTTTAFQPPPGSLLAQPSRPPTRQSHRDTSPPRSHHRRSSSSRPPLIGTPPQPPMSALNTPLPPAPGSTTYIGHPGSLTPSYTPSQAQSPPAPGGPANNTNHTSRHRSRSRPQSASSHRRRPSITAPIPASAPAPSAMSPPASSVTLNASRVSLNAAPASQSRGRHDTSSSSNHHANPAPPNEVPSSRSRPHFNNSISESRLRTLPRASQSKSYQQGYQQESKHDNANMSDETKALPQRPPFAHATSSQTSTQYIRMLLALDAIPRVHNWMASFFTWILLAGFILFPGTFTNLQADPAVTGNETVTEVLDAVQNVSLFVIAWICTGIGGIGMCWLWWRWRDNYLWIVNRIFVPGFLNSLAGVISTLSNVYGAQNGQFNVTSKQTIIVTAVISGICGILTGFYQFYKLRGIKKEHDQEYGIEKAGEHGEGVIEQVKRKAMEGQHEPGLL